MSVVLIWDEVDAPLAERVLAVALPSRKVIEKDDSEEGIAEYLGEFAERWKQNEDDTREIVKESSQSFYDKNFPGGELDIDPDEDEIPLGAFYWMILRRFDNQSVGSAIFSDDKAKEILREGDWFNAGR